MRTKDKKYVLDNGTKRIPIACLLNQVFYNDNGKFVGWSRSGSWGILAFNFTQPKDTSYFKILKAFYDNKLPMRLGDAKESIGIPRTSWSNFTVAVTDFGFLYRIPGSWKYQLSSTGRAYVREVLAGRDEFRIVEA